MITLSCYPFEKYNGMVIMKIATSNFTPCYILSPGRCWVSDLGFQWCQQELKVTVMHQNAVKPLWMDSTAPLPTLELEKASGDLWKCLQHTTFSAALYACSVVWSDCLLDTVVYLLERFLYGHQSLLVLQQKRHFSKDTGFSAQPIQSFSSWPKTLPWEQ